MPLVKGDGVGPFPVDTEVDVGFGEFAKVGSVLTDCCIVVGLPGAFTPTCSTQQVPDYLAKGAMLKEKGVDKVIIFCTNDGAVMQAWAKDQKTVGTHIQMVADPGGDLSKALGMTLTHPGPVKKLGPARSKRCAFVVQGGKIMFKAVAEAEDDPAGDCKPDATMPDNVVERAIAVAGK